MDNLTHIEAHGAGDALRIDAELGAGRFGAVDLIAAMDDHTHRLLARGRNVRRGWLVPRVLLVADLLGLSLAYLVATVIWGEDGALGSSSQLLVFVLTLPCWVVVAKVHGLYQRDQECADHPTTDDVVGVFHIVTIGLWMLLVASRLAGRTSPSIYALITFWVLAVCLVPVARVLARATCKRLGAYEQNAVIVGAGRIGQLIGRKLVRHPEYGVNVVGFVDRDPIARRADLPEHLTILGGPERLADIIESLAVERVVIAFSNEPVEQTLMLVRQLRALPVQIDLVPRMFEVISPRATMHSVEGVPLLGLPPARASCTSRAIKQSIDVVGALVGLIVLAPLFAYIALRIRLDSPGPILFRQTRVGTRMKDFTALKFRTMRVDTDQSVHKAYIRQTMSSDADANGNALYKLDRSDSVTKFGRWLRRTSLDELPQLINVLRGEMSLVGPRPCIPYEVANFKPHHLERFSVPQGITGLWQVTARAHSSYGESLDMDVAYVRGWSLGLDLQLLLRTPLQVLRQRSSTA
ncbi:MAG: sugar transferase [Solirubrobacterales bacterium]|nr:sugar transferase [Solirubrobacterales bacterium]